MRCVCILYLLLTVVRGHVLPEEDDLNETDDIDIGEYRLVYNERRDQFVRRKQRMEDVAEDYKQAKAAYRAAVNVELDQHVHHNHPHGHEDVHVHQHDDYSHSHAIPYLHDFDECSGWSRWHQPCVESYTTVVVVVLAVTVIVVCCVCLPCLFMLRNLWSKRRRKRNFGSDVSQPTLNTPETGVLENIFKL